MAIIGRLLKKGIMLRESIEQQFTSPQDLQKQELRKLLIQARDTDFGKHYNFQRLLAAFRSKDALSYHHAFSHAVPVHDYNGIYSQWWKQTLEGKQHVTWPGKINYFALSSGTSEASSKHIPVSKDMIKSMRKTSVRQILSLSKYDLPDSLFTKGILMLGGSTDLKKAGNYFEGDLSGITTSQIPFWLQSYYKPGKKISKSQWDTKLDEITENADQWDIGIIVGVPAWIQLLLEKVIKRYGLSSIHDIWPNLTIYVHGGVPFQPYKKGFERLLGKPMVYIETYLASEGFIGFQSKPEQGAMSLVLNNGIFYEFVRFNEANFTEEGEIKENAEVLTIGQVEAKQPYALLLSTNAGAWRYLIGDVIQFTNTEEAEIIITGRTKLFLSICGEHLSLDNMSKAIQLTEEKLNVAVREFTALGSIHHPFFGHEWYIGTDDPIDSDLFKDTLDHYLKQLNDDYAVERQHALKFMNLHIVPTECFYDFMKSQGKVGAQIKFPRVLKGEKAKSWLSFVTQKQTAAS